MKRPITVPVLLALATAQASAIIATFSQTSPGSPDVFWKYVGKVNGGSAVPIGPRTVLTAGHIGAGGFYLNGTLYPKLNSFSFPSYTDPATGVTTTVDIVLINLTKTLPGWYTIPSSITLGAPVSLAGYGISGVVNSTRNGYTRTVKAGTRMSGKCIYSQQVFVKDRGPLLIALLGKMGDAVVASGDSGGGMFSGRNVVGLLDAYVSLTNKYPMYGFANANTKGVVDSKGNVILGPNQPYDGSAAIDLTDPQIQSWIKQHEVGSAAP